MSKLKTEITRMENAISKLKNEIKSLDKEKIKGLISEDTNITKLLEELLENEDIQKKYPKYQKLKKLFYILPSVVTAILTILLIIVSIVISDITFTTFLPFILIAADYLVYHATERICDKKIDDNERLKPFYDLYGNKEYSAKRSLKDLKLKEKSIEENTMVLNDIDDKEKQLLNLEEVLNKLYAIRDSYIEQTIGEKYQEEIVTISNEFTENEEKGKKLLKK